MTTLVRSQERDDEGLEGLRSRVTQLEAALGERVAEVEKERADLDEFELRYRREVGLLHDQLDELEIAIAEAELGVAAQRTQSGAASAREVPPLERPAPRARYTSDAVRKLFRDVAKTIHPDLASDEATRDRRHRLMIEANRAYTLGDEEHLRWILQTWERSPEAVASGDSEAMRLRLVQRIAQIEAQLDLLTSELAALRDSPLWKLKAMVKEASARGKDVVRDMVDRLERDIMAATNRLDAMRPPETTV